MPDSNPIPKEERVITRANQSPDYSLRVEPCDKRVRAVVGGVAIADSTRVRLVFESKRLPIYYFPVEDVRMDLVTPNGQVREMPPKGEQVQLSATVGDRTIGNVGWLFEDPAPVAAELKGMVAFYWSRLDQWFEEDDEVYEHARDPYHRVDVMHASRHVEVVVLGETVADTHRPRLLFETGLPTRYYIPRADVRGELLVPSPTTSVCPYKGDAEYYSIRVGDTIAKDLVWYYRHPIAECPKIENLLCFFNEQVDAIIVDGEEVAKPVTPWSKPPTLIPAS